MLTGFETGQGRRPGGRSRPWALLRFQIGDNVVHEKQDLFSNTEKGQAFDLHHFIQGAVRDVQPGHKLLARENHLGWRPLADFRPPLGTQDCRIIAKKKALDNGFYVE